MCLTYVCLSAVNGGPEGAGRNQHPSAAVHGQNHPVHPGPQPLHPGDQGQLAVTQLGWESFSVSGGRGSSQLSDQNLQPELGICTGRRREPEPVLETGTDK